MWGPSGSMFPRVCTAQCEFQPERSQAHSCRTLSVQLERIHGPFCYNYRGGYEEVVDTLRKEQDQRPFISEIETLFSTT